MALNVSFSITAIAKGALSPIRATQAAIKQLQRQSNQIESYRKANEAILQNSAAFREAKQSLMELAQEYTAGRINNDSFRRQQASLSAALAAARNGMHEQRAAASSLRSALRSAGVDVSNLGAAEDALAARTGHLNNRLSLLRRVAANPVLRGAGAAAGGVATAFRLAAKGVALLAKGFGWAGFIIRGFVQVARTAAAAVMPIINTGAAFEKYGVMLEGIEGSSAKGKKAMAWINDFAMKTPMELDDVTKAYIQMKNFGLDPTNGSMMALVDMNSRMGGSTEKLQGMILALGQAWGKGRLQGDDILQLINAGVPVWDLLSKMTGKSVAELHKLSEQGYLGKAAIQGLIGEMGKLSKGAGLAQMKTWNGLV